MIFIGNGSFLLNALKFTLQKGIKINYVFSGSQELINWCDIQKIPIKNSNVNNEVEIFKEFCSDKIVFSINNGQLIKKDLLSLEGFKFYNIHNGIVPIYRGLPEICIIFAILNNEKEFGVSLHEIDEGIDTGRCIDIQKFGINEHDTFQSVMLKGIEYCNLIFCKNLDKIVHNNFEYLIGLESGKSKLYTYRDLLTLREYKNHSNFIRATKLGVFNFWYKKVYNYLQTEVVNDKD